MQLPLPIVPVPIPDWLHRRASRAGWSDWLAVPGDSRPHCRGEQEAEVRRAAGLSGRVGTWPRVGEHGDGEQDGDEGEEVCGE
jgi:hypothetical protein